MRPRVADFFRSIKLRADSKEEQTSFILPIVSEEWHRHCEAYDGLQGTYYLHGSEDHHYCDIVILFDIVPEVDHRKQQYGDGKLYDIWNENSVEEVGKVCHSEAGHMLEAKQWMVQLRLTLLSNPLELLNALSCLHQLVAIDKKESPVDEEL